MSLKITFDTEWDTYLLAIMNKIFFLSETVTPPPQKKKIKTKVNILRVSIDIWQSQMLLSPSLVAIPIPIPLASMNLSITPVSQQARCWWVQADLSFPFR